MKIKNLSNFGFYNLFLWYIKICVTIHTQSCCAIHLFIIQKLEINKMFSLNHFDVCIIYTHFLFFFKQKQSYHPKSVCNSLFCFVFFTACFIHRFFHFQNQYKNILSFLVLKLSILSNFPSSVLVLNR